MIRSSAPHLETTILLVLLSGLVGGGVTSLGKNQWGCWFRLLGLSIAIGCRFWKFGTFGITGSMHVGFAIYAEGFIVLFFYLAFFCKVTFTALQATWNLTAIGYSLEEIIASKALSDTPS
ncbi:hypothetical protein TNCV_4115271 [Trichonephila clavipes]|nr:hypothetical protein TNCV_4115271 [Trichonephila clavipes]